MLKCDSKTLFVASIELVIIFIVYVWVAPVTIGPANNPFPKIIVFVPVGIATGSVVLVNVVPLSVSNCVF